MRATNSMVSLNRQLVLLHHYHSIRLLMMSCHLSQLDYLVQAVLVYQASMVQKVPYYHFHFLYLINFQSLRWMVQAVRVYQASMAQKVHHFPLLRRYHPK